jgi:hypothetical protein
MQRWPGQAGVALNGVAAQEAGVFFSPPSPSTLVSISGAYIREGSENNQGMAGDRWKSDDGADLQAKPEP